MNATKARQARKAAVRKICTKYPSHGPHRVTKTGSYCYTCDRMAAEQEKEKRIHQ